MRFRAKVAVVESMGSELYAYFDIDTAARSAELTELARDAGLDEVPSHGDGEATQVVARLDAASRARAGEEVELALDTRQIKLFDSADGHALV
jgi:multiple sugar transport system ATP-binding protein